MLASAVAVGVVVAGTGMGGDGAAEARAAFEEVVAVYREAPALTDRMAYTVQIPGSPVHEDAFEIGLGPGDACEVRIGDFESVAIGDEFFFGVGGPRPAYVGVERGAGFADALARALDGAANLAAPPHVYMREGAPLDRIVESFGFGIAANSNLARTEIAEVEGRSLRRFEISIDGGAIELFTDPESNLMQAMTLRGTPPGAPAGAEIVVDVSFDPHIVDPSEAPVAFETAGRIRADSGRQLMRTGPEVGQKVSDLVFETRDGSTTRLSEIDAEFVVMDFWASWCGNCRFVLPATQRVSEWAAAEGLPVVCLGVNTDEEFGTRAERLAAIDAWWSDLDLGFECVIDKDDAAGDELGVGNLPAMVVVDRSGTIVYAHAGLDKEAEAHLKAALTELLAGE